MRTEPIESYERIYAQRHNIPVEWIRKSERLALAAFLEYQVGVHVLSVPNARRIYVAQYPDSNRLPVPKTIKDMLWNTTTQDDRYALGSVINMIKPYDDSIREVKPL